uniref:Uncharacterized protein n=1 Tax=Tetradesmus obliquus TaxID=3088 RepID=A0A383WCQ7_TETOB|eukprot:jgi/Sobl393_1/2410/SZX75010.1
MLQQQSSMQAFSGSTTALRSKSAFTSSRVSRGSLQVQNAITRQKKEEIVKELQGKLEGSVIVFGLRFKNIDVPTMQKFRRGVPEKSSVYICKNSLMKEAVKTVPGWEVLGEQGCTGDNAWVFVHEDDIPDTVKHWHAFSDDLMKEAKATAPKGVEPVAPTTLTTIVMDSKALSPAEFKRCENLPTKKQLQATIARLLKQPATKIASGIKAVPRKLAYGIKAIADLDEDKSKIVGDVAKPKPKEDSA